MAKETVLNCYMSPFQKWLNRWRLRRVIVALSEQVMQGSAPLVMEFAKTLEATELMSRGMKKNVNVSMEIERAQLDAFIRYMCSLHDAKLSQIMLARIGLATLITRDESILKQPAEDVIKDEIARSNRPRTEVIESVGKQLNLKI